MKFVKNESVLSTCFDPQTEPPKSLYANDVLITGLSLITKHWNKQRKKIILCIVLIQSVNNHIRMPPLKEAEKVDARENYRATHFAFNQ